MGTETTDKAAAPMTRENVNDSQGNPLVAGDQLRSSESRSTDPTAPDPARVKLVAELTRLAALGTAAAIAADLARLGVKEGKGDNRSCYCPLAVRLTAVCGRQVNVQVSTVGLGEAYSHDDRIVMPEAVIDFREAYDGGRFPELRAA